MPVYLMTRARREESDSEHCLCGPHRFLGDQPSHVHIDPTPLGNPWTRLRIAHGHLEAVLVHSSVHFCLPQWLTAFYATVRDQANGGQQSEDGHDRVLPHLGAMRRAPARERAERVTERRRSRIDRAVGYTTAQV